MKELSNQARAHLDALRSIDAPDAGATARVWDGMSMRAAAGELGPELPAEPSSIASATISIKSIALGVVFGAAVAAAAAAVVVGSGDDATAMAPALARLDGLPTPQPIAIEPVVAVLVPEAPPLEIVDDEVAAVVAPTRARTGTRAPRPSEPVVVPGPAADPVAEEVALLAEARSALGAGEAARAIGVLARHRNRFPEGLLARERDVSWITALCVLGKVDEARTKATSFLKAHGSSPHAAKVRASCGGRERDVTE